jgi:hypothetical protein
VHVTVKDGKFVAEEAYFSVKNPTAIGGVIKVGDHLYGTTGSAMQCLKFTTGELLWEDRALGPASMCYADNRLYLHGENGDVALVEPSSEGYRPKAALPLPTSRRIPADKWKNPGPTRSSQTDASTSATTLPSGVTTSGQNDQEGRLWLRFHGDCLTGPILMFRNGKRARC